MLLSSLSLPNSKDVLESNYYYYSIAVEEILEQMIGPTMCYFDGLDEG